MSLKIPQNTKCIKHCVKRSKRLPNTKLDVVQLRDKDNLVHEYSTELDKHLIPFSLPNSLDYLSNHIVNSAKISLDVTCPVKTAVQHKEPWRDAVLQDLIKQQQHQSSRSDLGQLQKQLKLIIRLLTAS